MQSNPQTSSPVYLWGELKPLLEVSASTVQRWEKHGIFPKRKKYGLRLNCWPRADVDAWLATRAQTQQAV